MNAKSVNIIIRAAFILSINKYRVTNVYTKMRKKSAADNPSNFLATISWLKGKQTTARTV